MFWNPYQGWQPAQPFRGNYPGMDGNMAGLMQQAMLQQLLAHHAHAQEQARMAGYGVVGPHVRRRSGAAPAAPPSPRAQRRGDELSGYQLIGYRAPQPGYYAAPQHGHGGMAGYDIVGQAAAEAALKAQFAAAPLPQQYPGLPQFMPQWGQAPRETGEPRRLTMPFAASVVINPATTAVLLASPQEPLRMERLYIDSDNGSLAGITVTEFKVGQQSQFTAGGALPASMFQNTSVGGTLRGDTANPGINVRLEVTNNTLTARTITAGVTGEALT